MIEFKAECGHTVRAKDEDAGGVVRCSYCGRKSTVPDEGNDDLDFLFADVDSAKMKDGTQAKRRPRRSRRLFGKRPRSAGQFNPFSIVLRMCYAALLICIVVFVARKFIIPAVQKGFGPRGTARPVDTPSNSAERPQRTNQEGLAGVSGRQGLHVSSVPPNAMYYCIEEEKAPARGPISNVDGHFQRRADTDLLRLTPGKYAIDVVLPTNDTRLNERSLPYYAQYRELRRALQAAPEEECKRLLEEFFVPDEAWPVFIDRAEGRTYIVRRYREVEVKADKKSEGVRALFVPKITHPGQDTFSISELVSAYLPKEDSYNFDEQYVTDELDFFQVPEVDRTWVIRGLKRVGIMPFVAADGATRIVKIGIHDGDCWQKPLRDAGQ